MSKKSQLRLSVDTMRFHCVVINNNRKTEKRRCLLFVVCSHFLSGLKNERVARVRL